MNGIPIGPQPTPYPQLVTAQNQVNLVKGVPVKVTKSLLESPSLQPDFAKIPIGAGAAQNGKRRQTEPDGSFYHISFENIFFFIQSQFLNGQWKLLSDWLQLEFSSLL